jgi:UDP-N-acetylmuramoylalanine-D-glutamate ligase
MQTVEWKMASDTDVFPDRIRNRRVAVLGIARSGGAVCEMLVNGGAQVLASDILDDTDTRARAERLRDLGVSVELGGHSEDALLRADYIVPSPGLSPTILW